MPQQVSEMSVIAFTAFVFTLDRWKLRPQDDDGPNDGNRADHKIRFHHA